MSEKRTVVRYAEKKDKDGWFLFDRHLSPTEFDKKLDRSEMYVMLYNETLIGILRYNLFWDNTPFCNMIYIDERYRRSGFGKKLLAHWENDMKYSGHSAVMTSTQASENGIYFFNENGYNECGRLDPAFSDPSEGIEIILYKRI